MDLAKRSGKKEVMKYASKTKYESMRERAFNSMKNKRIHALFSYTSMEAYYDSQFDEVKIMQKA